MNECAIKQRGRQWAAVFVTKLPVLLNDGHILRLIIDKVHRVQLYKTILTVVNSPRWLTVLASCKGQVDFSDHCITFFMNRCLKLQNRSWFWKCDSILVLTRTLLIWALTWLTHSFVCFAINSCLSVVRKEYTPWSKNITQCFHFHLLTGRLK